MAKKNEEKCNCCDECTGPGCGCCEECGCPDDCKCPCHNPPRMPMIGEPAPAFKANTTQGEINFPSDFKGKWIILFSHPADFTPVCTTEFMTFGAMAQEFEALNVQLVGLSVDSIYAHIAWLRKIQDIKWKKMRNIEVKFPLIEDIKMSVSRKYGMVQSSVSDTQAVRSVFFIDPKGIIRAMIYYPPSLGRNFDEIKRVILALQKADAENVATPADWRPGMDVILPAPGSCGTAKDRVETKEEGKVCYDWFLCFRKDTGAPARKTRAKAAAPKAAPKAPAKKTGRKPVKKA